MSMRTLELAILTSCQEIFENPSLKLKDLLEWSSAELVAGKDETCVWILDPGVWVCISTKKDKRKCKKSKKL